MNISNLKNSNEMIQELKNISEKSDFYLTNKYRQMKNMNLENLSKFELIKIIEDLKKKEQKPITSVEVKPKTKDVLIPPPLEFRNDYKLRRPIPFPRKSVKSMVQAFEQKTNVPSPIPRKLIDSKPVLSSNQKPKFVSKLNIQLKKPKVVKQQIEEVIPSSIKVTKLDAELKVSKPRVIPKHKKPSVSKPKAVPKAVPQVLIEEKETGLEGYTKSFEIDIVNEDDPLKQLKSTRKELDNKVEDLLGEMRGLKFDEVLKVEFEKMSMNEHPIIKSAYFSGKSQTIINKTQIHIALKTSQDTILKTIDVWTSEGSGWTIKSVENHYLNVVVYKPLTGSSYIKLPSRLNNSAKGLINLKNKDNECFRWCHIRHLNPQDKHPERIKKVDKKWLMN